MGPCGCETYRAIIVGLVEFDGLGGSGLQMSLGGLLRTLVSSFEGRLASPQLWPALSAMESRFDSCPKVPKSEWPCSYLLLTSALIAQRTLASKSLDDCIDRNFNL